MRPHSKFLSFTPYIIIKNTETNEIPKIQKLNKEDVDEIIEYQTIYSISISNMANKKINENIDESNKTIQEKVFKCIRGIQSLRCGNKIENYKCFILFAR